MRSFGWSLCLLLLPVLVRAQDVVTVAPGRGFDPALLAWRDDTSRIVITTDSTARQGPLQLEAISRGAWRGRPAIVHRIRVESPRMTMDDTTWYDPSTFAPLAHRSHGPRTVTLDYAGTHVTGRIVERDGSSRILDLTLSRPAFDPSEIHAVLGSVAWHAGERAELATFDHESLTVVPTLVEVEGRDTVQTVAGPAEAWRMAITFGSHRATYWLRVTDRVDLKVESEFVPGTVMHIVKAGVR
jgi:hypothetical protein